ncbi:MAG: PP2C family serine/threonine-protein phosphatase [Oligoflexales bacterium]
MKTLKIQSYGLTDTGTVRSSNQDAFCCDEAALLFGVADGMGGHRGGEVASHLSLKAISDFLQPYQNAPKENWSHLMRTSVQIACREVYDRSLEEISLFGMGTTATIMKIFDSHACIAHVGDSRLHLVRAGFLYQITKDHSLVQEQVDAGLLTQEEASHHRLRHVVSRCVGYQPDELVDVYTLKLENSDRILITSDGLHQYVSDEFIIDMVQSSPKEACQKSISRATEAGSDDNMTAVVVAFDREIPEKKRAV